MESGKAPSARDMLYIAAADRNKGPILEILKLYIDDSGRKEEELNLLEIASGTGQHVVYFAEHLPGVQFFPSDCSEAYIRSIRAYILKSGVKNVHDPIKIDVLTPYTSWGETGSFREDSFSFVLNINMVHITKIECTENLFKNSQKILKPGGVLLLYGPYSFDGVITPESNVIFDQNLRRENPEHGLRDVDELKKFGAKYGLELTAIYSLPANNHILAWKKM